MLSQREWTIPGYMVWFALAYAVLGSLLVAWIGKPLIGQNFNQQRFEADFRFGLIRIRENAEAVALYAGEAQETAQLSERFRAIRENWWAIMTTTKRLNVASTFYAQFAVIFPFLVGAPRYFSGAITLGGLMQIASAFGQVQSALSWFIDAFGQLAEWKASVNRLAGFHWAVTAARTQQAGISVIRNNVGAVLVDQVRLDLPNGSALTHSLDANILAGQRILVTGPSGCGKSTLFRAIAGIWPYGGGSIEIPASMDLLFLPQRSYLPIGTLRAAISYPAAAGTYPDRAIHDYLTQCRLSHLAQSLDDSDNWSQRLSPGEQQRLAFARALLTKPDCLFLDEASSALDADTEQLLYTLLIAELPDAAIISIAHRDIVAQYHQLHWYFEEDNETVIIPGSLSTARYRINTATRIKPADKLA